MIIIIIIIVITITVSIIVIIIVVVYLSLVSSSGTFPREQVTLSNLMSLGLALQFLQFQTMLLFAKVICSSLHQTSSASLSVSLLIFQSFNPRAPASYNWNNHNV